MAGIFDLFSDDPGQAANMMLAAGLLSGRGSFGQILGNSLAQAQGTYGSVKDQVLKRQLEQEALNQKKFALEQEKGRQGRIQSALQTFPQESPAQGPPDGNKYPTVAPSPQDYMNWAMKAYAADPQLAQFGFKASDTINAREELARSKAELAAQNAAAAAARQQEKLDAAERMRQMQIDADAKWRAQTDETRKWIAGLTNNTRQSIAELKAGPQGEAAMAPDLGLPKPQIMPWANQRDPKGADRVKASELKAGQKKLTDVEKALGEETSFARDASAFVQLNQGTPTGTVMDKVPGGQWLRSFGTDYSTMESLTAKMAPHMRPQGSGASSDYDAKQFVRASPSVDKPPAANKNIADAWKLRAQQTSEYQDFLSAYLEQNGTLTGADAHWKRYSNANPIFKEGGKEFELNDQRLGWKEWFSGAQVAPAQDPKSSGGWSIKRK